MTQTTRPTRVQAAPGTVFRATMPLDGGGILEWHCRSYSPAVSPSEVRFVPVPISPRPKRQPRR